MANGQPGVYSTEYPIEYQRYNTQYGGRLEKIGAQLWDTQTYTSGTTTQLTRFFNTRATVDLSNMISPFQIPAPSAFLVRSICFYIKQLPQITANAAGAAEGAFGNAALLANTGVMTFTVGNKQYAQTPLWKLTSGGGPWGLMSLGADDETSMDWGQVGPPDPRTVFNLSTPMFLAPQINFEARIDWPAAVTLQGGNTPLTLLLDGDMLRPVQ